MNLSKAIVVNSKKSIVLGIATLLLLSGCGSRQPNTISQYQPGDMKKSCTAIYMEVENLNNDINRKWSEKNQQTGANVALGVAGAFLLVPWFFMDFSGADRTEYESYKKRYDYLKILMVDKECQDQLVNLNIQERKAKEALKKEEEKEEALEKKEENV